MGGASSQRLPELDGVRGAAVLLILAHHLGLRLFFEPATLPAYLTRLTGTAWCGVDLFFVLSGFLIGGMLIDQRGRPRYFSSFYLRRACRILPLYLLMLAAIALLHAYGLGETDRQFIPLGRYLTFTQNFWMVSHGWSLQFPQTWSLAIEEQFYLTLPLLIVLVPPRVLAPLLIALAAAAPAIRTAATLSGSADFARVMLPCRMDALLLGVLAAIAVRNVRVGDWLTRNARLLYAAFFCLLAALGAMMETKQDWPDSPAMLIGGYSLLALLFAVFLLLSLQEGPIRTLVCLPWLRRAGVWAYGLYLIHPSVFDLALRVVGAHQPARDPYDWTILAAAVALVFLLAAASWRYLEQPLIRWGHRVTRPPIQQSQSDSADLLTEREPIMRPATN